MKLMLCPAGMFYAVLVKKRSERHKHCVRAGRSKVGTPPTDPPVANTHTQTGPITIHCAAKLSVQCNDVASTQCMYIDLCLTNYWYS